MRTLLSIPAIVLIALVSLSQGVAAQDGAWTKVYEAATSGVRVVEMFDGSLGLASTPAAVLRTTDGGATWEMVPAAGGGRAAFGFADRERVWAVGNGGNISRSDDSGSTWVSLDDGRVFWQSIAVVSRTEAWVAGHGGALGAESDAGGALHGHDVAPIEYGASALLRTQDGGETWSDVRPLDGYGVFHSVAASGGFVWVLASPCQPGQRFSDCPLDGRALLRTTDGGASWHVVAGPPDSVPLSVEFLDALTGFATAPFCPADVDCPRRAWRTDDGGETWQELSGSPRDVQRIRIAPDGTVWADNFVCDGTCRASLWYSRDLGATWTEVPVDPPPFGAFDANETHAVVASAPDGIARFDVSTGVWAGAVTPLRSPFWDLAFEPDSDLDGYGTSYRAFQVTQDGGRSWSRMEQPAQLGRIFAVGDGVLWADVDGACAGCTPLYRSTDAGKSWTGVDGPWRFIATLQPADDMRAWVVGDNGLWRTDDAGVTWTRLQDGNSAGMYRFIGRDFGYTTTCGIYLCDRSFRVSHDGGVTWETRPLPPQDGLTFVTPEVGFAMRYEGNLECPCTFPLIGTTDGGRTWHDLARLDTHLGRFTFVDHRNGWATGGGGNRSYVFRTSDGGRSWTVDLALPEHAHPLGLHVHGDTLTLHAGAGAQGLADQVYIFERRVDVRDIPPVTLPGVGVPSGAQEGASPWVAAPALAALAAALAAAAIALRTFRRR